jgi:hypothetical protein
MTIIGVEMSSNLKADNTNNSRRVLASKIVSVGFFLAALFALYTFHRSVYLEYDQSISNWQTVSSSLMIVLGLLLGKVHGNMYWVSLPYKAKIDERQMLVRNRVLTKSYRSLVIVLPVTLFLVGVWINNAVTANLLSKNYIGAPFAEIFMFLYALPSAIASWQKDA